jgi:hypothetical protein
MRKMFGMLVIALASVLLFAQQGTETKKPASAPAGMEAPKPSPEIEKLTKWMVGTWQTDENFAPAPEFGMPNGGKGKGISTVKLGPGGFSLIDDYKSRNVMGRFAGHGVTYWDPAEKVYKSFWIDSMSGKGETQSGKWEGNDLVFLGESDMGGKKVQTLGKMTNITPTSYTFKLSNSATGEMKEMLVINYKKVGAGAADAKQ